MAAPGITHLTFQHERAARYDRLVAVVYRWHYVARGALPFVACPSRLYGGAFFEGIGILVAHF